MMTNENLISVSETLKAASSWNIFTHAKSDGDAVGSASALFEAGLNEGKNVKWFSPDKDLPETYKFLSHTDEFISRENFDFNDDNVLYIFLDCSNENRSVKGFDVSKNINVLNIDHHEDNSLFGKIDCVDGSASSTCEMLYRIFKADKWKITPKIAESLYLGMFTDTGGFSFSNTTPSAHAAAAEFIELGIKPDRMSDLISQNKRYSDFLLWSRAMSRVKIFGDNNFAVSVISAKDFEETKSDTTGTEGLSNMLMTLRGIKLASTIVQYPDGIIRLSIRSREGSPFGAGELARMLNGGGHERAAGALLNDVTIEEAQSKLEEIIMKKYHECVIVD